MKLLKGLIIKRIIKNIEINEHIHNCFVLFVNTVLLNDDSILIINILIIHICFINYNKGG